MFDSKKLPPGRYRARCKEKTLLSAAANGHSSVFPEADCVLTNQRAEFFKNGKSVWSCNVSYAAHNFQMTPIQ